MTDREMSKKVRAVVVARYGECECNLNSNWCRRHDGDSRIEKGMSVCNVFVDWMELAEEAVKAVESDIRADIEPTAEEIEEATTLLVARVRSEEQERAVREGPGLTLHQRARLVLDTTNTVAEHIALAIEADTPNHTWPKNKKCWCDWCVAQNRAADIARTFKESNND
jgi:hypothetical protein